jgi:hypothetical protein
MKTENNKLCTLQNEFNLAKLLSIISILNKFVVKQAMVFSLFAKRRSSFQLTNSSYV